MTRPGEPTAFEQVVDDYDAARPGYPAELYGALGALGRVLELGAGTGIATRELLARGAQLVATDLGPRMLARNLQRAPGLAAAVCRAEALPFREGTFDLVAGAQMWHWVDVGAAAAEVARVLCPGGRLAVWWNEVDGDGLPWWDAQQDRLEAGNPAYRRDYRFRDHGAELLATGRFACVDRFETHWERELDWPTYERELRSKSYVQALGAGLEPFVAAERASLAQAFPDGRVTVPFRVVLWTATVP